MTAVDHEHAARLVTHLSQQRSSGKYCDVCVCVAEQRFLAHKCVLSANSDQLDALILDATDEDNTSHDIEIEIHGVSPVGFEIVLEYFYTGVLRLEPSTVTHTWMTAVYLGLPDIVTRCNSYCQQSVCVTAHPKSSTIPTFASSPIPAAQAQTAASAVPIDLNNNGAVLNIPGQEPVKTDVPTQLTTSTILSSSSIQPRVNSIVKQKESVEETVAHVGKDHKPEPFEIRENPASGEEDKDDGEENAAKKAKLLTMDENAIAWNAYGQHASSNGQPGVTLPVASMPQVVVNLVQGYGTYQPVDVNWSGAQHWAQVQVGKGQFVTAGMIPVASQIKHEPVPTPATAVQLVGADNTNSSGLTEGPPSAGESSPISYTTLSLVSQDTPQQPDSRNDIDSAQTPTQQQQVTPSEAVPNADNLSNTMQIASPRSHTVMPTQELNLDNIHFTQMPADENQQRLAGSQGQFSAATTSASYMQPVAIMNNLALPSASGDESRCETILMQSQVQQLRMQHQQLQKLQLQTETTVEDATMIPADDASKAAGATSKRKRKAPTRVPLSKSEDGNGNTHELHAHSNVRKSRSLADTVLVTITPEHMEYLYQKYPEIKKEPTVTGTCDVMQLLQHGKARQRKSSEQNALNNTIRTILDTTGIVESGDSRVQDAVCLIMDRFAVLQEHMNDMYVRKQLTIKVKHSIHCKKWRLKRHKMKQLEMSSSSSPDARASWMTESSVNSSLVVTSNNALLTEESLHS